MMNETTAQQLRRVVAEIRRKPYPISDLIPLLDKAASELEDFHKLLSFHQKQGTGFSCYSVYPDVFLMNKNLYYTLLEKAGLDA